MSVASTARRRAFGSLLWLALWIGMLSLMQVSAQQKNETKYFTDPLPYGNSGDDMWEPFVAASPNGKIALWSTTSYKDKYCKTHHIKSCADPLISYRLIDDQNKLSDSIPICIGSNSQCSSIESQNDPVVAVTNEGLAYFIWMNDYNISVVRADSFEKLSTVGFNNDTFLLNLQDIDKECDKPWIAAYGDNVVAVYSDYNEGHLLVRGSNDRGRTWWPERKLTNDPNEYHFPSGAYAGADGSFCFSTSVMPNAYGNESMKINMNIFCSSSSSSDAPWMMTLLDVSDEGPSCPDWAQCDYPREYLLPSVTMAGDTVGSIYVLYALSPLPYHTSQLYFKRHIKDSNEWSTRVIASEIADHIVHHCFPMIAATGDGDVRIAWMDNRTGYYNLWYRESVDWGHTWSEEVRVSTDTTFSFEAEAGFLFPFGDYGGIMIDQYNRSVITWGEGGSWAGPGMTFIAFQLGHPAPQIQHSFNLAIAPAFFFCFAIGGLLFFFTKRKNNEQYASLHLEEEEHHDAESASEANNQDNSSSSIN